MFDLRRDQAEFRYYLFFNTLAADQFFALNKQFVAERNPVFSEVTSNGVTVCLFHVNQPRADPEGGCVPMDYYTTRGLYYNYFREQLEFPRE